MTIHTRVITSVADLAALGPRYDTLIRDAGDAGLFYATGWLERTWPYYHARAGGTMQFVIAERGDRLVGLAPLVLVSQDWLHARRRVLAFVGGTGDELDNWMPTFLVASREPEARADIMRAFVEAIARLRWDHLELRLVREACPSLEILRGSFPALTAQPERLTTPRVRLDEGWSRYWGSRSKRLLRMIDRGRSRAGDDGLTVRHEVTIGVPDDRRPAVAALHRARQQQVRTGGRSRSSPFEDTEAQHVFWSLIDWATAHGSARTYWLLIGNRIAAYVIALHHSGTTFAYLNAMDPAADRYHPGSLVLAGMIEREATEYGARVIDLMAGANLTKSLFATEELANTRISTVNHERLVSRARAAWIVTARRIAARMRR